MALLDHASGEPKEKKVNHCIQQLAMWSMSLVQASVAECGFASERTSTEVLSPETGEAKYLM